MNEEQNIPFLTLEPEPEEKKSRKSFLCRLRHLHLLKNQI